MIGSSQDFLAELSKFFEPLALAGRDPLYRRGFFGALDLDILAAGEEAVQALEKALERCEPGFEALRRYAFDSPAPPALLDLLAASKAVSVAATEVASAAAALDPEAALDPRRLLRDLLSFLTIRYLTSSAPLAFDLAALLTLIRMPDDPDGRLPRVEFELAPRLLSDPTKLLAEYYMGPGGLAALQGPGKARLAADRLFPRVAAVLAHFGIHARYERDLRNPLPEWNGPADRMLTIQLPLGGGAGSGLMASFLSEDEGGPTLLLAPFGTLGFAHEEAGWSIQLAVHGVLSGLAVGPHEVEYPGGPGDVSARVELLIASKPDHGRNATELDGTTRASGTGTRLEFGQPAFRVEAELKGEPNFVVTVETGRSALVIHADEGDGFLQQVLPRDGLRIDFDLAIGWSSRTGLHFRGAAGLEADLAIRSAPLGVAGVDRIHLALRPEEGALGAQVSTTFRVRLGPVIAVIERMGLQMTVRFPPEGGNLGLADLESELKPPDGAALMIDSGPVSGGGYLFFDPDRDQYAGAVQLEVGGKLNLGAIGLLTTRLPDGSKGFSLLVIISASGFAPIQLGFGFTLNGVGGLIGVHRTAAIEALRSGVRTGTMEAVLFPKDLVQNAPAIVSTLNTAFPPARDRYLIGPMAVIGWGTPTVLTLKLALILEVPQPVRLAILGRISALLPDEDHALVRIQMDALGLIDFDKGEVSLDATLYDSRLLQIAVTGDAILRARWGRDPYFILAVGGCNPRFPVPAGVPALRRIALDLTGSDDPRLRLEAYLALTSNTAQIGARLDFYAGLGGFSLIGFLGFDALFQFAPFGFAVDLRAAVALRFDGRLLAGILLDLTLSGPSPWHVVGRAEFSFLFLSFSFRIDQRFGPEERPPLPAPVDVIVPLLQALRDSRNWSAELPAGQHPLVTLRGVPGAAGILAHPLAALSVRQRVVPLEVGITRYGNAPVLGDRAFRLDMDSAGSPFARSAESLVDYFAPGAFADLSDDQKLAEPAFRPLPCGLRFRHEAIAFGADLVESNIDYETLFENPADGPAQPPGRAPAAPFAVAAAASPAGDTPSHGVRYRPARLVVV